MLYPLAVVPQPLSRARPEAIHHRPIQHRPTRATNTPARSFATKEPEISQVDGHRYHPSTSRCQSHPRQSKHRCGDDRAKATTTTAPQRFPPRRRALGPDDGSRGIGWHHLYSASPRCIDSRGIGWRRLGYREPSIHLCTRHGDALQTMPNKSSCTPPRNRPRGGACRNRRNLRKARKL